ncbi:MAG: Mu-like prophage major head subunit gpT family protein [Paracoccus sp. (in: a-proteobacteria)]|uniref:phage major capsid protein n=1 Tax=Paracoccus sp. TaxID=267 RepID=UPI0039E2EF0C
MKFVDLAFGQGDDCDACEAQTFEHASGARQSSARDFRLKCKLTLGDAPALEQVYEHGEFKSGTIAEGQETYKIDTFGKIIGYTRQAMINDDLGALMSTTSKFGIAARAFENDFIVKLITSNPALSDGKAVFHADHRNLAVSGDPDPDVRLAMSLTTLANARLAMRWQTSLGGMLVDVTPRVVLVPPELETPAEQLLADIAATKTDDVNPFDNLTLLVEPRLTDTAQFYIVADPATVDGLEYAYLEGAPGPQIETRAGFEVDGVQIKVRLDFGSGWIDHRGWYRVN